MNSYWKEVSYRLAKSIYRLLLLLLYTFSVCGNYGRIVLCWCCKSESIGCPSCTRRCINSRNWKCIFSNVCNVIIIPTRVAIIYTWTSCRNVSNSSLLHLTNGFTSNQKKKKNDINYYYRFFNEIYSYINLFLGARINIRACVIYNNNLLARWFKKYNRGLWIDITYHNYHHECLYSMWLLFIDN